MSTEIWLFILGTASAIIGGLCVIILNSIREEIRDIKVSMQDLNVDLRGGITGLDRRVTIVEERVSQCEYHRRSDNGLVHN